MAFHVTSSTRYKIRVSGHRSSQSIGDGSEGNIVLNGVFSLSAVLLGDVNLDTEVNFLDISPFIAVLSTGGFQNEADLDQNGLVDFLDIAPFITALSSQ